MDSSLSLADCGFQAFEWLNIPALWYNQVEKMGG
jgi:hypothetical protein